MPNLIPVWHAAPATGPRVAAAHWPLSAAGRARCAALAAVLAPYLPAVLFSSREAKAAETAALTARALAVRYAPRAGLEEHARASAGWLGAEAYHAAIERLFARPAEGAFGDESAGQAHARFAAAVHGPLEEQSEGNANVFARGTAMALFVAGAVAGVEPLAFWRQLGMPAVFLIWPELGLEQVTAEVRPDGA